MDDENSLSPDFVFWEDKGAFPGPEGRIGHPDLTQNIGQTPDGGPAALSARHRHADRGGLGRRDRRHRRLRSSTATGQLSGSGPGRAVLGHQASPRRDHEGRLRHARRLLIEAAWHYRRSPRISLQLRRRQQGQPPAAVEAAWRAQLRLHRRWAHLDGARGKRRTMVAVAVARELACFVWEIAQQPD